MEVFEFRLEYYNISLFEKHLTDLNTLMPEFNRPSGNKDNPTIKIIFDTPKNKAIYIAKKTRLRRARWLVYQNFSHFERIIKNEILETSCRLCGMANAYKIYNHFARILKGKKFHSIEEKKYLIKTISVINNTSHLPHNQIYSSLAAMEMEPFNDKLVFQLKFYEQMYGGYCSSLCREIDSNRKNKNPYL